MAIAMVAALVGGSPGLVTRTVLSAAFADDSPANRERVVFTDESKSRRDVSGKILVEAQDGGLLVLGEDGRLWTVEKEQLESREKTGQEFRPLSAEALGKQLQAELGTSFEMVATKHYVICSSAGKQYALWCGSLFERLYAAFQNYWKLRGVELVEPEFPLVALVFRNESQFAAFATNDAGPEVAAAKGYYSIGTNRIVLYDLTATGSGSASTSAEITRRLSASPYNIATVIHEATHQIAFNSGMHTRYADNPLWLSEGMAMYFETPDLTSRTGWKTVGVVNDLRLRQFLDFAAKRRKPDSLATLLESDSRFTDVEQMGDAYAEAWALNYFLIKTRKEDYATYLKRMAEKPRLVWNKPGERLAEFKAVFGDDLPRLDSDCVKYVRRLGK